MVYRIYVEKRPEYAVEARGILSEIRHLLRIKSVTGLRLLNRYDVEGISEELFSQCCGTVFSEPQLDFTYTAVPEGADAVFATEFLPGQFDQRAASAAECIQLISQGERPDVQSARVFLLYGAPSAEELAEIKKYVINPVEAREASLAEKATLKTDYAIPTTVETLEGFTALDAAGLADFVKRYGLAMDEGDIAFCQSYFKSEHRDPTITEIRMIDTYWSDHCRHTTFGTILDDVQIEDETVKAAWERYLALRREVHAGKNKPVCLMDLGTIGGKYLKKTGVLKNMDESDEINACSVRITVDNNGTDEPWLLLLLYLLLVFRAGGHAARMMRAVWGRGGEGKHRHDGDMPGAEVQALILACGLLMCGLAAVKIFELWGEWRWLPSSLWGGGWLAVPAVMLALLAVMGVQSAVLHVVGKLTFSTEFIRMLCAKRLSLFASMTVTGTPAVLLAALSGGVWADVAAGLFVAVTVAHLALYAGRSFLWFIDRKVSILLWILYLCAVEAMPFGIFAVGLSRSWPV